MKAKKVDTKDFKIKENYLYIRILPQNEQEFNSVNSDIEIDLFEYPLDYKIKKQGNKYKDPSLKESNYTWLYCAVPITKEFDKKIKIEVLEKLFLPFGNGKEDEYGRVIKEQNKDIEGLLTTLEDESLTLTGNKEGNSKKNAKVAYWQPSGRIRVWDERLWHNDFNNTYMPGSGGFIPVPQCLVRANRLFSTYTVLTNEQGFYTFSHSFSNGDLNFSIKWDREDFDIRSGTYGQAYYNGPSQSYGWNLGITETTTPDNYIYAHVHRAAWTYFYKNIYGIKSPPTYNYFLGMGALGLVGHKLHLGAVQGSGNSAHYFDINDNWFAAEIRLKFLITDNVEKTKDARAIFGTTIHELAHTVHWKLGFNSALYLADLTNRKFSESWAQMVGWYITKDVYKYEPYEWQYFDHTQSSSLSSIQGSGNTFENTYTPLFIDLVDNYNQNINYGSQTPNDNANGYSIQLLESILEARPVNYYQYRDYLESNTNNPTETAALWLFNNYD